METEIEEDRHIFRLFMEHSPVYVFVKDDKSRLLEISRNYENLLGKPTRELLGKTMDEFFPPELAASIQDADLRVLRDGKPVEAAEEIDGRAYQTIKFPIAREGKPSLIAGFTIDITERKLAENALKDANERLQAHVKEIELLHKKLQEQAIRDPLTGLFNRRYLQATLDREIARASRGEQPIGLIIMDIDHFKKINDAYGHQAGDRVLKLLGELLRTNIRAGDIPCRYGGEEFVIVMPGASLQTASDRAELVRAKCEAMRVAYRNQELHITMSLGVAAYPLHGLNSDAVLIRADRALYRAKQKGRNCVVPYQDTNRMPPPV